MKILLDENIPAKVKFEFGEGYDVFTVRDMNWLGRKNGELLGLAAFNDFEVFITLDKNLKNQQNLNKVELTIILLLAKDNKHQTLQLFIKKIKDLLIMKNIPKFNEISL
jgi:predicted nuclease of predicted toxin-antitoxin system